MSTVDTMVDIAVIEVSAAEYLEGYRLRLRFNDGAVRAVDFEPFLAAARNPMNTKYRDLALFRRFEISDGDLQWNDYEMCFPAERLYAGEINVGRG